MTPPPDPQKLLDHAGWTRDLARRLVRDPHLAEDVAQDALAVALESAPRGHSLRAFLGGVVRNLAREARRKGARRHVRELRAARREALPSTVEALGRLSAQRELVDALEALEEPYRTTLVLRFLDGHPPRAIAAAQGVPVKTVKTRLSRGLARLRARLSERYGKDGDGGAWLAALVPLAFAPRLAPAAAGAGSAGAAGVSNVTLGAVALNLQAKLILSTLVCAGAASAFLLTRGDSAESGAVAAGEPAAESVLDEPAVRLESEPVGEVGERRVAAAGPEEVPAADAPRAASAAARAVPPVAVRVLDSDAQPVAGVTLGLSTGAGASKPVTDAEGARVRSGRDGRASFPAPERAVEIVATGDDWLTLLAGVYRPGSSIEPAVVLARPVRYGGLVVDDFGRPVAGARVTLERPADFDARFDFALEASQSARFRTTTDADGRFAFEPAPLVNGARVLASAEGFETALAEAPGQPTDGLLLALRRHRAEDGRIAGRVIGPDGSGVEDARVVMGAYSTSSDADGAFEIDLGLAVTTRKLLAVKPGYLPATLDEPQGGVPGESAWPGFVELALGGPPLAIEGRVVDEEGAPIPDARVWVADPSPVGFTDGSPATVEGVLAGAPLGGRGRGMSQERLSEMARRGGRMREDSDAQEPSAVWWWVTSDSNGGFRLEGLVGRDYTLSAMDPATLIQVDLAPVAAGARGVELVLSRDRLLGRVAGTVKSSRGEPLEGVTVRAYVAPFEAEAPLGSATLSLSFMQPGPMTTTDAEGAFAFDRVPKESVRLMIMGDAVMPSEFTPPADADREALEVTARGKCHVEVIVEDGTHPADSVSFRTAEGRMVPIFVIRGGDIEATTQMDLVDGRTGVVAVPDDAARVLFLSGGEVVEEREITLVPGEVTELRPSE